MSRLPVWAVVVARLGPTAKSRLAPALVVEERSALAVAMLLDVLQACADAALGGTVAVIEKPDLLPTGGAAGAFVLLDPRRGLNAAVQIGLHAAVGAGAGAAIVLPGDVPLVGPDDLFALLAATRDAGRAVVVATDRAGTGTNALLLRPAPVIPPSFGPGSAARHLAAGLETGAVARRVERPRLALDVDTPADLAELGLRRPGGATGAMLRRLSALRAG